MRDVSNSLGQAANSASSTAGSYGATAGGIGANLVPFLTRQMSNPQGFSQRDQTAQLANAQAGAGGATAGLTGAANKEGAVTRNPNGFSAALDAAARSRDKAAAGAGERVASNNADVKLKQQQEATQQLGGLYGTAGKLQTENAGQVAPDLLAKLKANQYGWMQQVPAVTQDIGDIEGLL